MIFRVILSLGLAMSLSCCKSRASEDSSELADGSKSKKAKVIQGYDLTGFKTLDAAQQVCGLEHMLSSSKGQMPKNDGQEKSEVTISNLEAVVVISFFGDAELQVAELNWKC